MQPCFIIINFLEFLLYAGLIVFISLFDHDDILWDNTSNIPISEVEILKLR